MAMSKTYLSVDGRIMSEHRAGEASSRDYMHDPSGNVVGVYQNDYLVADAAYDPYGDILDSWNMSSYKFTFAGAWGYRQTGLAYSSVYVRARHYSPLDGGWTTRDPLWPSEMPYGYVEGRVPGGVDYWGLVDWFQRWGNSVFPPNRGIPSLGIPDPVYKKPPPGKKYVWISGERSAVGWAEPPMLLLCDSSWKRIIHPTDTQVIDELIDADYALFWGHGASGGGAYLYNHDITGKPIGNDFFTAEDAEVLIKRRHGRKMKQLIFLTCESVKDCESNKVFLRLAEVVVGYDDMTYWLIPKILDQNSYPSSSVPPPFPEPLPYIGGGRPQIIGGRTVYD